MLSSVSADDHSSGFNTYLNKQQQQKNQTKTSKTLKKQTNHKKPQTNPRSLKISYKNLSKKVKKL